MISRLTKIQLIVFLIITLVGGAFVGGRYAKIDRLVVDRTYHVNAQFSDSGGIFSGAQVTYRGLAVGRVGTLTFKDGGVDIQLDIEKSSPKIPADVLVVVANKSAVGEQFIDLQPRGSQAPYLANGTHVSEANTRIPIPTSQLLLSVNDLVKSVNTDDLKTLVDELGTAFNGTSGDLGKIIDTTTSFLKTASANLGTTHALVQDSTSVLQTQIDKGDQIASFSKNLALFSDTLASSDSDLRRLIAAGAPAAKEIRGVINQNSQDLTTLVRNIITVNKPAFQNTQAVRALFILDPYLIEGAPSTLIKNGNQYDVSFGLVVTPMPAVCKQGYDPNRRAPQDVIDNSPNDLFNINVDCTDPKLVPRNPSKTVVNHNRVAASGYDPQSGNQTSTQTGTSSSVSGKDSLKWLLLGPASTN